MYEKKKRESFEIILSNGTIAFGQEKLVNQCFNHASHGRVTGGALILLLAEREETQK